MGLGRKRREPNTSDDTVHVFDSDAMSYLLQDDDGLRVHHGMHEPPDGSSSWGIERDPRASAASAASDGSVLARPSTKRAELDASPFSARLLDRGPRPSVRCVHLDSAVPCGFGPDGRGIGL